MRITSTAVLTIALRLAVIAALLAPSRGWTAPPKRADDRANAPAIDFSGFDFETRPQDDFFRFVNGSWIDETEIPGDRGRIGSFITLRDEAEAEVKRIVEEISSAQKAGADADQRKIADAFSSYMDEARIEALGLEPIERDLERIDQLKDRKEIVEQMARSGRDGVGSPLGFWVDQDAKNPDRHIATFTQTGLGLPDKNYYFDETERGTEVRRKYRDYVTKLFELGGDSRQKATEKAAQVIELETAIAKLHWERADSRDRDKTYNKWSRDKFEGLHPLFSTYLRESGLAEANELIVRQPSYYEGLAKLLDSVPVEQWKSYLRYKTLGRFSPYLTKEFRKADFEFHGRTLGGLQQPSERWRGGIGLVNGMLGEAIGREYVKRNFPPEAKRRMSELVKNLRGAMGEVIAELDWMDTKTKREAERKLERFVAKIGHPETWRDYSRLEVHKDDLVGNVRRASRFEHRDEIERLGKPVDRREWHMTPQTVNAYYNSSMNEVVFPAAILQPPFFNLKADDAVNYGAIGMVIGHELGHGFDDQGRKVDADGKLNDWWSERDAREFSRRADRLVEQYDQYEPVPGAKVNGRLTLGENIADHLGITVAYRAYQRSLEGKRAPKIDGFTGRQRFFLSYAQIWRGKAREEYLRQQVATDPHSPPRFRVNGVLENFAPFHRVWKTRKHEGKMYKRPERRVRIW